MADRAMAPPAGFGGMGRRERGRAVVKPKNMRGTLRRLWDITKGHREGFSLILVLSAFSSLSAVLSPLLIGKIISAIREGRALATLLPLLVALYIASWLVKFLQQFFMASVGQKIIHHIRLSLFDAIRRLPLVFFDKRRHGELMSRLTNDVDNISATISNSLTQLLSYAFTVTGIFVSMLLLNPLLTMVSLLSVFFVSLITRFVTRRTRPLYLEQQRCLGEMNGQIEESISAPLIVKAFCREGAMVEEFEEKNEKLRRTATKAMVVSGFLMPMMNVVNNLSYVGISVFGGVLAAKGVISIGVITSFLLYVRQFTRPFVEIANVYNEFQSAVAGAERVFEIMDAEKEPEDAEDALPLEKPRGEFALEDVSFAYQKGRMVLRHVNLHIPAGTKMAIVGETGAGKTTLINLLTRFYDVTSGRILLDGHDIRSYRLKDLRRAFGVVLQDTALFADTVKANIAYGSAGASMEAIEEAARTAGADLFISRLPLGYDTLLSQGGAELSQGERQLLTIARAMLSHSPILILDEATSSVDTVTEKRIREAILKMSEGRTSFIIAHRLSTIRDSDVIVLLEDGMVAEMGSHDELMERGGVYTSMYRTQMGV